MGALWSYPKFLKHILIQSFNGSWRFYAWMTLLTAIALVGANAWAHQVVSGMQVTGLSDHVSWGFYIANFTFGVGVAAGAAMMVIPAYLYDDHDMHGVVIIGELLAIAAIVVCTFFILVDMGRPDRLWHIIPGLGRFNWPVSMLTWDVLVLNGYLLLNLHICGYLLYARFRGQKPDRRWYVPFVFISIIWAFSIHSVTAFLYSGLGGRPFWNSALLAPRFIVTAFVSGPALVILLLQVVRHWTALKFGDGPIHTLARIARVTVLINLFMLGSELFTALYSGGAHATSVRYLFFGLHGHTGLVPWIWTALVMNVVAAILLHSSVSKRDLRWLNLACVLTFIGIWIEKGMGLIVPGFIPSTLHEIVEYVPTITEWKITAGIWAGGLMVLTVAVKVAVPVLSGETVLHRMAAEAEPLAHDESKPAEPGPVSDGLVAAVPVPVRSSDS